MARLYIAAPHTAAGALTRLPVAAGAVDTQLQIGVPANLPINIWAWGISFRGVAAADPPGDVWLLEGDVAASSGTSLTPDPWQYPADVASSCVGGAALTCYGPTVEGTITASRVMDGQLVHPQTGYSIWFPSDGRPRVGTSSARYLRIRTNFTVAIDCFPWIIWDE